MVSHEATLRIHERLAGDPVGDRCPLTWSTGPLAGWQPPPGKQGIWLLQRAGKSRYQAGPPGFRELGELAKVRAAIASPLFLVDTRGWKEAGRACCLRLTIRTFLPRLAARDFISVDRGRLVLHGRAWIEVRGQLGEPLTPKRGGIVAATGLKPLEAVVTRERPYAVSVDLRRIFPLARRAKEIFHLRWGTSAEDSSPSYTFTAD